MTITDADRDKARHLLDTAPLLDLGGAIAQALADGREKALGVGRCGAASPNIGGNTSTAVCELRAGHAGWHKEGGTEWGIRRAAEEG